MHRPRRIVGLLAAVSVAWLAACETPSSPVAPETEPAVTGAEVGSSLVSGTVAAIDLANGTFALAGGTTVRLTSTTRVEGDFRSLSQANDAMRAGARVNAAARGTFEENVLIAANVDFQANGESSPQDRIEGIVKAALESSGRIALEGGTQIQLRAGTSFDAGGNLGSVAELAAALQAGLKVRAEATGTFQNDVFEAATIRLTAETTAGVGDDDQNDDEGQGGDDDQGDEDDQNDDGSQGGDEGLPDLIGVGDVSACTDRVVSVDRLSGVVRLASGTILTVDSDGLIDAEGDLRTLADAETALAAGADVVACAETVVDLLGVLSLVSLRLDLAVETTVANTVRSVDSATGSFTLSSGTVVDLLAGAQIDGDAADLAEVAAALQAGATVRATAAGFFHGRAFMASRASFEID